MKKATKIEELFQENVILFKICTILKKWVLVYYYGKVGNCSLLRCLHLNMDTLSTAVSLNEIPGWWRSSVSKLSEAFWWYMYLLCLSMLENYIPTTGDQKTHQWVFKFVSVRSLLWIWSWEVNLAAVWFWTGEEEGEMLLHLKKHCKHHGPSREDLSFQTMRCTGTLWLFRQARCE